MDSEYLKKCEADVAKADEEIAILQKHITDAENIVVAAPAQSWKYKASAVTPKQREKEELIARLKEKVVRLEASVIHMRSILQMEREILESIAEVDEVDREIARGSARYYSPCPVDFQKDFAV